MKLLLATLATVALAIALQLAPRDIPPCKGKECDGGHTGQPSWCQNSDMGGFKANCKCKRDCSDPEQDRHRESGCFTWCRTSRCLCDHGCPKTE